MDAGIEAGNKPTKFQTWYGKNKEALNKKRRNRYKKDRNYREQQLANTREWRKRMRVLNKNKRKAKPKTHFTIGEVAEQIGCNIKTIRILEGKKLLPSTTDGTRHRKYTRKQIGLIAELIKFRQDHHYKETGYKRTVERLVEKIEAHWGA